MHSFRWEDLITPEVIDGMLRHFPEASAKERRNLANAATRAIRRLGGAPIIPRPLDEAERRTALTYLLNMAMDIAIGPRLSSRTRPTQFIERPSPIPEFAMVLEKGTPLDINSASEAELIPLKAIGPKLAHRIVQERTANGPFLSTKHLMRRVPSLSAKAATLLAQEVRIDDPAYEPDRILERPIEDGFRTLAHGILKRRAAARALRRAREEPMSAKLQKRAAAFTQSPITLAASDLSRIPPLSTGWFEVATSQRRKEPAKHPADWVGLLRDGAYYKRLPMILDQAKQSLDICMFHIAFPDPKHPTAKILDAVVRAKARGVAVRVLMDQDRKEDPYLSVLINTPARRFLEKHGIECRFDRTDNLLHSKYVVVDGSVVVMGSHNWTAGSYFQYDDISVVIHSATVGKAQSERFATQWAQAEASSD
jgi:competence protein ComEA